MSSEGCVFTGDADCFPDDHLRVASNGVHRALAADDDSAYFTLITGLLPDAVADENSRRIVNGKEFITLNSAPEHGEQTCAIYLTHPSPDANWQINDFAPKFQGLIGEATVLGTCAWPNELGGEVALAIGSTQITAVVPDFYLKTELLTPGSKRFFRFSASAEALALQSKPSLSISQGPLYEEGLDRFLKDHPEKTKADFPEVIVSLKGMHALTPQETSTFFEIISPVLSCETTTFLDHEIKKIRVILYRDVDGEDILLNLYASPEQIPDGFEVGCDLEADVRLFADPVKEMLQ